MINIPVSLSVSHREASVPQTRICGSRKGGQKHPYKNVVFNNEFFLKPYLIKGLKIQNIQK